MSIAGAQKPPAGPAASRLGSERMVRILSWLPRYDRGWLSCLGRVSGIPGAYADPVLAEGIGFPFQQCYKQR